MRTSSQGWRIVAIGALFMMLGMYDLTAHNFGTTIDFGMMVIGAIIIIVGRMR